MSATRAAARLGLVLLSMIAASCASARSVTDEPTRAWLENMAAHGYTDAEVAAVLSVAPERVPELYAVLGIDRGQSFAARSGIDVLPYPGGRHPRIGFLDGAIDPHRDTKVSVFLPWPDAGYVVVDVPEAISWDQGDGESELLYLAHTHFPTHWTKRDIELERIDWAPTGDGGLRSHRELPNRVEFTTRVLPREDVVDFEMTLHNGTDRTLTGLKTQVCVLLKGAPAFAQQTNDNKLETGSTAAVRNAAGDRWVITHWTGGRTWCNSPCPCMHSDPTFADVEPGGTATLRGRLSFYEGEDITREIARRRAAGTLGW